MKRWMIGFFTCYALLPVGLFAGIGLFQGSPLAILIVPYYALLLSSLFQLSRQPGVVGLCYKGALLGVFVHLLSLAGVVGHEFLSLPSSTQDHAFKGVFLGIFAVYVAASGAGAAMAAGRGRSFVAFLQLLAPAVTFLATQFNLGNWGSLLMILSFGGQGFQALLLGLTTLEPAQVEKAEPGFTPSQ